MRPKLSYGNVVATLALFIALGGASYAALKLPKNSVGPKQLKKNAVTTAKIKKEAVTAAKVKKGTLTGTQINASTLGTVPQASLADSISPPEAVHRVGARGEPQFEGGSGNLSTPLPYGLQNAGFYKDHEGIVHLVGGAKVGTTGSLPGLVFTLPPGYRPASGTVLAVEQFKEAGVSIFGSNNAKGPLVLDGDVVGGPGKDAVLDGITFRAES